MLKTVSIARAIALLLLASCAAWAADALILPNDLPPLDKRGGWRETLEDLVSLGVPQNWTLLGPISNENSKSFDRPLAPELSDDWTAPMTDNLGRLLKVTRWSKPKEDDGCYVDLADIFNPPPISPVAWAQTAIDSPVDGPALLWFENAGRVIVYFNNRQILNVTGKLSKIDSTVHALYPLPIDLKRGRNILKVKMLKEKSHYQKGWGFFARIERDDLDWRKLLLSKLKDLYPEEDAGLPGALERLLLGRRLEKNGQPELAAPLYREVAEKYGAYEDACEDANDSLKRLATRNTPANSGDAGRVWIDTERRFKAALTAAQTLDADRILRDFIAQFPFSEQAGLALCGRGGLRLDYACDEAARPFNERALRECSGNETVRTLGVKGLEFARFAMPEHARLDTDKTSEAALAALHRQLRNGNAHDNASGLKALAELLLAQPNALVQADGPELYPRWASVNLLAREFLNVLTPAERTIFREPLARPAESAYRQALPTGDALELEDIACKFPGAPGAAKALNQAGNLYLDRGLFARAAQAFKTLQRDFKGSGLIDEPLAAAKEIRALVGLGRMQAARDALAKMSTDFNTAKFVLSGREIPVTDFVRVESKRLSAFPLESSAGIASDYETFGWSSRRLGAPTEVIAPILDHLKWSVPMLPPSEFAVRARSLWSEDRTYSHIESFPVVSHETIFCATRQGIRALNKSNGNELWKDVWNNAGYVDIDRKPETSKNKFCGYPLTLPIVKDQCVFVRVINTDKYSVLRCYDAVSGRVKWSTDKSPSLAKLVWSSEPLAAYNLIIATYFEALDHDTVRCGSAALDAETGRLVWNRPFGVGNSGIRIAEKYRDSRYAHINYQVTLQLGPPSAFEGMAYTATGLGSLAALNAYTGDIAWIAEYPRLRAGNLYTGNSGIDGFLPRILKVLSRGPSSPVVGEKTVALAPRDAAGIIGFDRRTGELRWAHDLLDARFIAGVCDGKLLAVDDTVTALDLDSGVPAWTYSTAGKRVTGQPGLCGGMLYLPCDDGLHVVDAHSGALKTRTTWDPKTSGPLVNLVVSGSQVIGVNATNIGSITTK
ncbi:MAG: PQQ-binding-like beta-propeller repeat protein [Planctomycetota bacterium]